LQRAGLARGDGKTDGDRAHRPVQGAADDRGGAGADSVAPADDRCGGAGPGGIHRVPLRVQRAREDLRHRRVHDRATISSGLYARYLVRLEEMRQSLHIIRQLIDNLPGGPVNVSPEGKDVLPPKDQVYSSIEGLIHHFELIMTNRGFEAPKGEVYFCIESGNGELGYYIVSAGESVPWRARTRPCSFINYQSFPKMIEGHMVSDVPAVLGSINVIAAELDR